MEEQAWGGLLGLWRPAGAHRRSRGSEHNSSTPGQLLGQAMGVPRGDSLRNRCIVDKAPPLSLGVPGGLPRGPLRAT